jgi:pyruvate/2-oxoglutarate dehydrogenase complex dihydrolipoamide dehydrogenase (E3) component
MLNINSEKFDAVIIGTGQSGKPLAFAFGDKGLKTAVIERKYVGGTCINYGCTPTKSLIASAKAADVIRNAANYGLSAGKLKVNIKEVIERKNRIVKDSRDSGRKRLQKHEKIELIFGDASFVNNRTISIKLRKGGRRVLEAGTILINTGTSPFIPKTDGLKESGYFTSSTIMEIDVIPKHLAILGGGYIGVEFAQMFRRFGSDVTIIQKRSRLLPNEDEDISAEMKKILEEDGIKIILNSEANKISVNKSGKLLINVNDIEVNASHLLVATGLVPNTPNLNLESTGVKTDLQGYIVVNDRLETGSDGIYASGDVKGGPAFTHISYDDYRVLKGNLLENKSLSIKDRLVPYTIFTDPQLGRVGITEAEAIRKNLKFKTAKYPMSYVARAIETGETRGFMKAIVDSGTNQILGCAILGSNGGELMSMIQIAMMAKMPYTVLKDAVFTHPLYAESLNSLFTRI